MIRDAVILAAGKGTRLRASDDDLPKPLQLVRDVPLIKRTILTLAEAGVTRVVVVTGFMADLVSRTLLEDPSYAAAGIEIVIAHNPDFEKSNGISVLVGGAQCAGPFLLSMADHVYTAAVVKAVAAKDLAAADLYLATDKRIHHQLDITDATKVSSYDGRIVDIGKTIETYDRIDCGVFAVTQKLLKALEEVRQERGDCSLSEGVRRLADLGRARCADIGNAFWQDVDTPADRDHAEAGLARETA
ncbi:MAG: NTP transferase domain-containing protein [Myxococcota bacterium]|nr:NTP transferase domain-containing protein [Myxococcota bacterium]